MSSKRTGGIRSLLTFPRHRRADMWAGVYRGAFGASEEEPGAATDATVERPEDG